MGDGTRHIMKDFWDAKARENAMYYISSYRAYDAQDPDEFWKWGAILAGQLLDESGIPFAGDETMLEIGCGIGRMTATFAGRFAQVHGIDVSGEMIRQAASNLEGFSNVALQVGNGSDLSCYADGSFDFVFSYITFQHIPDANVTLAYIREAGRVLKAGGHFYFQVNNMGSTLRGRLNLGARIRSLLARRPKNAAAGSGPRDLDHPAWQGSRVTWEQIGRACDAGALDILSDRGRGTQYLWVKAVKRL